MQKMKRILTLTVILSVLTAAFLGLLLVLDVVQAREAVDTIYKALQVFGIVAVTAAVIVVVLRLNEGE